MAMMRPVWQGRCSELWVEKRLVVRDTGTHEGCNYSAGVLPGGSLALGYIIRDHVRRA